MMKHLVKILSLLTFSIGVSADTVNTGGDLVNNGGGGVCYGEKCLTLAEAGFRVATPDEPYYILPPETTQALQKLADRLPMAGYREQLVEKTIGNGQNLIKLEVADPNLVEAIRKQYAQVLKDNDSSINIDDVKIFAFSRAIPIVMNYYEHKDETYLLPDFFLLTPDQQAKVLIHERNVRYIHAPHFTQALELDGYIEDLQADFTLLYKNNFQIERWTELLKLFYPYNTIDSLTMGAWLAWFDQSKGITFDVEKFCSPFTSSMCRTDKAKIMANYAITPGFLRHLSDSRDLYYEGPMYIDSEEARPYKEASIAICRKNMTSSATTFLFPFNFFGSDYHLTLVKCSADQGEISVETFRFRD